MQNISGLTYISKFMHPDGQIDLLKTIDEQPWLTDLRRRVQHYGYKYDYRKRAIDSSMALGKLPVWLDEIAVRLNVMGLMPLKADQAIINEYYPGQGIAAHVDCEPCFGDVVVSLSLGSKCVMDLRHRVTKTHIPILLEEGSLLVLSGEARYDWTHGIEKKLIDSFDGRTIARGRRVSVTFRTVIIESPKEEACDIQLNLLDDIK